MSEAASEENKGDEAAKTASFREVKLCSKNGAILMEKAGKGTFICFSTQNTRIKGETAKQKIEI